MLVLSKFAGAARQLPEALLINPYDRFEVAEAIRAALYMPKAERLARWKPMVERMTREDVDWWARNFLAELENFRTIEREPPDRRGGGRVAGARRCSPPRRHDRIPA